MSENKPLQPARQTDWEAANSAEPDAELRKSVGWDSRFSVCSRCGHKGQREMRMPDDEKLSVKGARR